MYKTDQIIAQLKNLLPQLSSQEKLLAREIYLGLLKGNPVRIESLANTVNTSTEAMKVMVNELNYVEFNIAGNIKAFRGLTLDEGVHKVSIDDYKVYTWCAFDALFVFELILSSSKQIKSVCPACKQAIKLNESNIGSTKTLMSFILPDQTNYEDDLKNSFCCEVNFYCGIDCANQLTNPHLKLLKIYDAMLIASERNRHFLSP